MKSNKPQPIEEFVRGRPTLYKSSKKSAFSHLHRRSDDERPRAVGPRRACFARGVTKRFLVFYTLTRTSWKTDGRALQIFGTKQMTFRRVWGCRHTLGSDRRGPEDRTSRVISRLIQGESFWSFPKRGPEGDATLAFQMASRTGQPSAPFYVRSQRFAEARPFLDATPGVPSESLSPF